MEDSLRHRLNVELENFRGSLQHCVSDQFTVMHSYYKHSNLHHNCQQMVCVCQCNHVSVCVCVHMCVCVCVCLCDFEPINIKIISVN